jgi:hypothetical protein
MSFVQDSQPRSKDDTDLIMELRSLFKDARNSKRSRYNIWVRNYGLVNNRSPGKSMAASTGSGWMPQPQDSEIYPTCSSLVGWMTDQNTQCRFTPACDPNSELYDFNSKISNDLGTVVKSAWENEDYTKEIKLSIWDSLLYGVGILKTVWDAGAGGGYGNAVLRRTDPYSFYPDPNGTSLEDCEYFVEAHYMSFEEIERKYPDRAWQLEERPLGGGEGIDSKPDLYGDTFRSPKANPGALPGGQVRYGQSKDGKDYVHDKGYVVYEFWLKENSEDYDNYDDLPENMRPDMSERIINTQWRVVVIAEDVILFDADADELWSYASHPYERFVFDDIGEFYGIALVDHLSHPQIYINRLLTALQHNAELVGNPIFMEAANSGLGRTAIINRPGQRLTLTGSSAMQNKPDWLTPPSMPDGVMKLVEFWISRIESISGLSAMVKGATPTARNAEGVISSIQEAAFVRIRAALRNMEKCLEGSVRKVADLIIDNYNEPRMLAILGQDGSPTTIALSADHFMVPSDGGKSPLQYSLNVEAGSNSPTSRQARIAEADKLVAMGVYDDVEVLKVHQVPNYMEIIKRKDERKQSGLYEPPGAKQAGGHTPGSK